MTTNGDNGSGGVLGRVASGMTSVAGITTAVATIMTSVTAILGFVAHHQAAQLEQAHRQVAQQARQIRQLQSRPAAVAASPAANASSAPTADPAAGSVTHYLSSLTPTVDNQSADMGQEVIAAKPYPDSISFYCSGGVGDQPSEAYDVAGSSTFTALVGIADNEQDVTGVIATVTFSNESGQQLGKPVQVSLGHPIKVTLNITGLTQLGITCNGRDQHTSQTVTGFRVALGDAGIS
ncbi:MAG: hypothetical protein ACM3ML_20210 [Micromonosporaceae bacterium]